MDEEVNPHLGPVRSVHHRPTPFWKSKKFLLVIVAVVIVFLIWLLFIKSDSTPPPAASQTKTLKVDGTAFPFPGNWQQLQLTNKDKKVGVILKLGSSNPSGSFVWRAIKGNLDKNVNVLTLPDQLATSLTNHLTGTQIISKEVVKLSGHDSVKIRYTRPSSSGSSSSKVTNDILLYVVPLSTRTYYLTFATAKGDFSKLEAGFNKILASFVNYISTRP